MSANKKIKYIYDDDGNKTEVIVPINKYERMLEDLADLKSIEKRRNEKSISLADVRKKFNSKKNG